MSDEVIKATCPHDCPDTCGMLVKVENGVAVSIKGNPEHPNTGGTLCTKVSRYIERTYHKDRLKYPMQRVGKKGEGKFQRISWDNALNLITRKLKNISIRDPRAILPYSYAGTMGIVQGESMAMRFFNRIGASKLDRTICASAGGAGYKYSIGAKVGTDNSKFDNSKLILIWGGNPIVSNLHFWSRAQNAKRKGAKLICIDPYKSLTAEKCNRHIALIPGTDAALALGMMHVICKENLVDYDYVSKYTIGFEKLLERLAFWTPEYTGKICGISSKEVEYISKIYALTAKKKLPVSIRINYGLQRTHGGGMAVRNISCLPALVGAWRHESGGILLSSGDSYPINFNKLFRLDSLKPNKILPSRTINMNKIGSDLLKKSSSSFGPAIEALIVYNSNPVAVAPDSSQVVKGFQREDLYTIVLEHFKTDTADYADILLPATTQLEHSDIHASYGHLDIMINNQAIKPIGECKSNSEIFRRLASKMGFTDKCFQDSDNDIASEAFDKSHKSVQNFNFKEIKRKGWMKLDVPKAPFKNGGFFTPSGKCEFYSEKMKLNGYDPLPSYIPPYESKLTSPDLAKKYPLSMISPPQRNFLNTTFVNVKSLRNIDGEPNIEIHPEDAKKRNIKNGDYVKVFNDRGFIILKANITPKVRLGLVVALSIWWKKLTLDKKNANELTSQRLTDMGRGPTFYDTLVEIIKI